MPTHRGVVIRADHSGGANAGNYGGAVGYRAVYADKIFRGSLESVMQQIDDALGSTPTARIPVKLPPPPRKKAALNKVAAKVSPKKKARQPLKKLAKKSAKRPAPKKKARRK